MLAGMWVLIFLPLMDVLNAYRWDASVPVPAVLEYGDSVRTLNDTLLSWPGVYQPLVFCIGVVLLFSKERGRRRSRMDWTRRWGVICSYVVLLLSAAPILLHQLTGTGGHRSTFHEHAAEISAWSDALIC